MKLIAMLGIFVIFAPIASYAQLSTDIIIEPEMNFSQENPDVLITTIAVTVEGYLQDEGNVKLIVEGLFGSDQMKRYEETYTLEFTKRTHVFELDYTFTPEELYEISVVNGITSDTIEWIPPPLTQIEPESEKPQNDSDQVANQRVSTEKSTETSQEVTNALIQQETTSVLDTSVDSDFVQSLIEENELLKQKIEKKDAVIMEQLKVIQDLASQIRNAISNESTGKLYFVANTSEDFVQSLIEENELLKQKIEKKDAVIMEQLKVIQDLASQIRNTISESTLNYFSII